MRSGSQAPPHTRPFQGELPLQDRTAIVRAIGELDLAIVQVLDDQLVERLRDGFTRVEQTLARAATATM